MPNKNPVIIYAHFRFVDCSHVVDFLKSTRFVRRSQRTSVIVFNVENSSLRWYYYFPFFPWTNVDSLIYIKFKNHGQVSHG